MKTVLFNSHDIVLLVVAYICFLFALMMLLSRRKPDSSHIFLGFFLLSQACIATYTLALYGEAFHHWSVVNIPGVFVTLELALWLEGPLLLLYVRSAIYQQLHFKKQDLLLLVPLFIYFIVLVVVEIKFEAEQGSDFLLFLKSEYIQYYEHLRNVGRAAFGFWAFFIIRHYQNHLSTAYSNTESVNYAWLKILVIGFITLRLWSESYLIIYTLVTAIFYASMVTLINFNLMGIIENYGQLLLVSTLLFFALSDPRNILRVSKETLDGITNKDITKTDKATPYSAEQVTRVCNHMEKQRPYLNNQLKIDDLAQQVSISAKLLSNLINREFKVNFFEYINSYRLKEVSAYLNNPEMDDQSIIELAFLAGYNSKSSFNRLFKLDTGKTPSQFRKER
ncbi:MAG: AraC family transcriptional regulator [Colwellia sp.]|nr:AraC family transcriptional regulator [Colwellia sp.]